MEHKHDPEALRAALQLLLSDLPTDDRARIVCQAFPGQFIRIDGGSALVADAIRLAEQSKALRDQLTGQSGMGAIAVRQLADTVSMTTHLADRIAMKLTGNPKR